MTARSDHDQDEAAAHAAALDAISLAGHATQAFLAERPMAEVIDLIRRAGFQADLAVQRAWPFLDETGSR